MTNPYIAPQSDITSAIEQPQALGWFFWTCAIGATLLAILLGSIGTYVIPAFEEIFAGFGADLPVVTLLLLAGRQLLWGMLAVAIAIWVWCGLSSSRLASRRKFALAFLLLAAASLCGMLVVMWILYLPIFQLGAVVS